MDTIIKEKFFRRVWRSISASVPKLSHHIFRTLDFFNDESHGNVETRRLTIRQNDGKAVVNGD